MMNSALNESETISVIKLREELIADCCAQFRSQAQKRMEAGARDFVLDMTVLETIDSQGLEALLWLQDTCAENLGQVRLVNCPEHVAKILEITRLAPHFDRHITVEAAIASLQ